MNIENTSYVSSFEVSINVIKYVINCFPVVTKIIDTSVWYSDFNIQAMTWIIAELVQYCLFRPVTEKYWKIVKKYLSHHVPERFM